MRPVLAATAAIGLGLAAAACGPAPGGGSAGGGEPSPALPEPTPGGFHLAVSGDALSLRARGAPLREVLEALAGELPCELWLGSEVSTVRLDLDLSDEALAAALPDLLQGLPYRVGFRSPADGLPRLARLEVGVAPLDTEWRRGPGPRPPMEGPAPEARPPRPPLRGDARSLVRSGSRAERLAAIEVLSLAGEDLEALLDTLAGDPSPEVRAAAARALEDVEGFAGVEGLVQALDDPSRDVVIAAIESLEFAGDASNVADLMPLARHGDPSVRRAARAAVEFLAD